MKWQHAFLAMAVIFSIFLVYSMGGMGLRGQVLDTPWQNVGKSLAAEDLRMIVIDPLNPNKAFLASGRGLLVTDDAGKSWKEVLDLSDKKIEVSPDISPAERAALSRMEEKKGAISGATAVAIDPSNPSSLFVGSPDGLYRSDDGGVSWNQVDSAISGKAKTVTGVAISSSNPDILYCASLGGLMKSDDAGKSWKAAGVSDPVNCVAIHPFNPEIVYAGVLGGVKKTDSGGKSWVSLAAGPDELNVLSIATDFLDPKVLYFGTDRGLYRSDDEGISWSKSGLEGSVEQVAISPADSTTLYAATSKGIYGSTDSGKTWSDLMNGIPSQKGKSLAFDPIDRERLWVVGDKGVFLGSVAAPTKPAVAVAEAEPEKEAVAEAEPVKEAAPAAEPVAETVPVAEAAPPVEAEELGPPIPTMDDVKTVLAQFAYEPTVQEIQEVAMRFAEVHPDKIEAWRRGAKWRAFLPEVKMRFTHSRTETKDDTWKYKPEGIDRYVISQWVTTAGDGLSTTTYDEFKPKFELDLGHEREIEDEVWVEMKWKLGDFLYSKAQVDISDESAELAEFRNEVLEQVTQFYFQRRQFQVDLLLSPPEDLRERIRMEIQLQEMTANIDYLSGGYMTARINEARFGQQTQEVGFLRGLFRR